MLTSQERKQQKFRKCEIKTRYSRSGSRFKNKTLRLQRHGKNKSGPSKNPSTGTRGLTFAENFARKMWTRKIPALKSQVTGKSHWVRACQRRWEHWRGDFSRLRRSTGCEWCVPPDRECHTNLKQRVEPLRYPHFCNERAVRAAQGGTLLAPYSSAAEQRAVPSSASYNSFIPPDQILPLARSLSCIINSIVVCKGMILALPPPPPLAAPQDTARRV